MTTVYLITIGEYDNFRILFAVTGEEKAHQLCEDHNKTAKSGAFDDGKWHYEGLELDPEEL